MKKVISLILVVASLFTALLIPVQAAQPDEISPQYVTAKNAYAHLAIGSSGDISITARLTGFSDVTKISVTTVLEKEIENIWGRVLIGPWTYSVNSSSLVKVFTGQINARGNYRAISTFTVTGDIVETITVIDECIY